jgi:hypothetical protein
MGKMRPGCRRPPRHGIINSGAKVADGVQALNAAA